MKIGHGFLSGLLPKFSDYDALLYIFVLSNYFSSNKSKKTFEKGKINIQTSSVHVLCRNVLFFLTCSFCSFYDYIYVANISKVSTMTPTF